MPVRTRFTDGVLILCAFDCCILARRAGAAEAVDLKGTRGKAVSLRTNGTLRKEARLRPPYLGFHGRNALDKAANRSCICFGRGVNILKRGLQVCNGGRVRINARLLCIDEGLRVRCRWREEGGKANRCQYAVRALVLRPGLLYSQMVSAKASCRAVMALLRLLMVGSAPARHRFKSCTSSSSASAYVSVKAKVESEGVVQVVDLPCWDTK